MDEEVAEIVTNPAFGRLILVCNNFLLLHRQAIVRHLNGAAARETKTSNHSTVLKVLFSSPNLETIQSQSLTLMVLNPSMMWYFSNDDCDGMIWDAVDCDDGQVFE